MNVGDRVSALDEDVEGIVVDIDGDIVTVVVDEFDMKFTIKELIVLPESSLASSLFSNKSIQNVIAEKEMTDRPIKKSKKEKKQNHSIMEVDLHAHQLTRSTRNMSKHEVLNLQINTAKHKIEFAMQKRIQKIVFIHGVGEGVLKMELETLFRQFDNLKYYDADYKKYGYGATEVMIYLSAQPHS